MDSRLLYQSSNAPTGSPYNNPTINGIGSVSSDVLVKNLTMLEVSRKLYQESTSQSDHDNESIDGVGCTELEKSGNYLDIYLDQKLISPGVMDKYKVFKDTLQRDINHHHHHHNYHSRINITPLLESYNKLNQVYYGYDCSCVTLDINNTRLEQSTKKARDDDVLSRPLLIIIRHGKTEVSIIVCYPQFIPLLVDS